MKFLLQLIVLVPCFIYAQVSKRDSINLSKIDTTYIKDISDNFIVKMNLETKSNSYSFTDKNTNTIHEIAPNLGYRLAMSLDYKFIGISIGIPQQKVSFLKEKKRGNTSNFQVNFSLFFNYWLQNFNYTKIRGFYATNNSEYLGNWDTSDPTFLLPDYSKEKIAGATSYIVNGKKFSYRNFLYQTQIQKISAGSLIPRVSYYYLKSSFDNDKNNFSDTTFFINFSMGYQYNWVVTKRITLSGGGFLGTGIHNTKMIDYVANDVSYSFYQNYSLNTDLNLAYQLKKFFIGIQYSTSNVFTDDEREDQLVNASSYGVFYIGYRFDAPRIVEKPVTWIENLFTKKKM